MHKKIFLTLFVLPGVIALATGFLISLREGSSAHAPLVVATPIVQLKDGDRFQLESAYVTKMVGGASQTMMAYNSSVPGPEIHVKQGDTILVHFVNHLDQETLLHSHGIRMENAYDGTHLVQNMMKPGDSFDYKLTFPDPGVFIYHPHAREDLQQDLGLYGSFIVEPKDPNYWLPVNREQNIVLDDLLIEDGAIAPHSPKYATHALMGRFGNTMLVNGLTDLHLTATSGEVVRYYLTNTANTRTFAFTIPGALMKLVGGDGGRYERETFVDRVDLSPSERAVVDVYYEYPKTYTMTHNPGAGGKTYTLATVDVKQGTLAQSFTKDFQTLRSGDLYGKSLSAYRSYLGTAPDKTLLMTLSVDMQAIMGKMGGVPMSGHNHAGMDMSGGMMMGSGTAMGGMAMTQSPPVEWEDQMGAMNIFSTDKTIRWILRDVTDPNTASSTASSTQKENLDVHWAFTQGDMVKLRLVNDPKSVHPMQHPFHVHGMHFLVLSTNGVVNDNLVWKDTTQVKAGDTVDILIPMDNLGKWMAHCHIAEHLATGMVVLFDVVPKEQNTQYE